MAGTDFYDYKEWVETAGHTDVGSLSQYYLHYEKPYYYIINFVQNDYFFFRLVVWGSSLLLFVLTARRLELDKSTFTFYLCICIVQLTSTSRVCLAYALAFYGFSLLIKPLAKSGVKLLSYIMGVGIIALSLLFHKSTLFLLAVLPISLVKIDKKTIWLLVLIFPAMVVIVNTELLQFVLNFNQTETSLLDAETASYYLDSNNKRTIGLGQQLEYFLKYCSHLIMIVLIVKSIIKKDYNGWPLQIRGLANATLFITVFSSVFLFTSNATTFKTFERLLEFSYVPESFFLAYLLKANYEKKLVSIVTLLLTGYVIYGAFYYNFYFGIIDF